MKQLIILLLLAFSASAQSEWKSIDASVFMEKIRAYEQSIPVGDNYSIETGYKIYKDYADQLPVQSFEGKLVCRKEQELNVNQMGLVMVQNTELNITIDTLNKQLLVQHPDSTFFYRKTINDFAKLSEMMVAAYEKTDASTSTKITYMLELKPEYPYHAMEFEFTEENTISRVVIYSNQPYYVEDDAHADEKAKIVLEFKNFRKGKNVDFSNYLNIENCVLIEGNELKPIGKYKEFELIDLRN